MPSDLRIDSDETWDLERWPGDWNAALVAMWLEAGEESLQGKWGLSSGVFIVTTGQIKPDSLPATAAASITEASSVFSSISIKLKRTRKALSVRGQF